MLVETAFLKRPSGGDRIRHPLTLGTELEFPDRLQLTTLLLAVSRPLVLSTPSLEIRISRFDNIWCLDGVTLLLLGILPFDLGDRLSIDP